MGLAPDWLLVGSGGFVGSVLRYGVGRMLHGRAMGAFPWATLGVNLVGCLLIGLLLAMAARLGWPSSTRLLLVTGFCGGFTTFSAFSHETLSLLQAGHAPQAGIYVGASVVLGLAATWLGYQLG